MTSCNPISHVCETRIFVMAILHWKRGLLCDKKKCSDLYQKGLKTVWENDEMLVTSRLVFSFSIMFLKAFFLRVNKHKIVLYTTQNLLRNTFSFNDLMLKTNRLKKYFFYKDRLVFGLDDPVANMSIRHVYNA